MRLRPVGLDAVLLEVDEPAAWFGELWRRRAAGELSVTEIVPGARTVLLDGLADVAAAVEAVRGWAPIAEPAMGATPGAESTQGGEVVEIPVIYDGPDLASVAAVWDMDIRGAVELITATSWHVAFCGFTPGWAYLAGLPEPFAVPRLQTPRSRVPAGSVALADAYAGIYPTPSPGGWRIVGRTDVSLFDPDRDPPALLAPGIRVRFVDGAGA